MKILFVDSQITAPDSLLTGLLPDIQAIVLDGHQDGIAQISSVLQQNPQIQTLHIVSHGSPGCLYLGNGELNLTNIYQYQELLQHWNVKNIVLYGCNVAAGDAGEEFIRKFHEITKAQITATATKTGNPKLGGDWNLEVNFPTPPLLNYPTPPLIREAGGDQTQAETPSPPLLRGAGGDQTLTQAETLTPPLERGTGEDQTLAFNTKTLATYQGVFAPTLVGQWDRLSVAYAVTVVGNYAYAVHDTLEIIDITNPSKPIFKGNYAFSDFANGVQVVGNLAYVADDTSGLKIIDISNPLNPLLKGTYDTSGYAIDVQVVGNYAYVADNYSGLAIIDVSNPLNPTLKGTYHTSGIAFDVQLVGNYAYIANLDSGLAIIDISNPVNPTLTATYDTSGRAYAVQVVGNYAYVADESSGLQIIDVSNPLNPTLKGSYDTFNNAESLQILGNYAYVADGSSGLAIIDISNPINPTLTATYGLGYAYDVEVVNNYAYVANFTSGLAIIDISNPVNPTLTATYDKAITNDVQIVGNYAYVANGNSGLAIIDISNPVNPLFKGSYNTSGNAKGVKVFGNYAYVADDYQGLAIIDISNPVNPTLKGTYGTSSYTNAVQVVGNYAYVADYDSGLQIIDITNPLNPLRAGTYNTSGIAFDVQVVGNYAYVADYDSGLQIIDITNPLNPLLTGTYDTSGLAYRVQVVGNYAYVADESSGLQIIDITNPLNPLLTGTYDTPGLAYAVQVVGDYAYVADYWSGLAIINVSNPLNPLLKATYNTTWTRANAVQVVGNYAYVADGEGGLKIIDVTEFVPNPPTNITLSTSNIAENLAIGTVVGNLTTTDPNPGDTFTYSLVSGTGSTDNASFTLVGNQLQTNAVFNFETKNSYTVRLRTTDQGGLFFDKQFTIGVTNVNETPTNLTLSALNIAENQAIGTVVGNLTTTDPDASNTFTYSLVTGTGSTDNASFTIAGNQLKTNASFNFEAKSSYSVRLRTTDQGGLYFEKQLTIGVTNVNETPTNLTLSNLNIAENQALGTVIGNLTTTDPDTGSTFTYSLVTGTGSTDNASFTIVGNQLKTNGVFDFETKNSYSILVRTTDQNGLFLDKQFTIGVTNLNEPPTNITLSTSTIAENLVIGTVVGTLNTTDPDASNTFTYSLVTGTGATDNASFTIVGNQLQSNAVFNYEAKNSYSILVRTTDQNGLFLDKQLTIGITNVNETPTNITLSNLNIAENQAIGTVVGNLTTTDTDASNTFTYSLVTGTGSTDNASFTIVGNQLKSNAVFNYEAKNSYSVLVRTTDQNGLFLDKQLTIGITNVNETPTNIALSNLNIAENLVIGTVVGTLNTTDPDASNTFTYSLVTGTGSTDNASFTIVGNQLQTNGVFDFETKNSYTVRLRSTDQGGLFFEKQFTIGVTNVNETPTNIALSNLNMAENQAIGTVVGNLTTTDPDASNTFTYSLVTGTGSTDNASFTIVGNQLQTNGVFDFETKNSYSILVRTTDQNGLFLDKQFALAVTNVNETPTNLTLSNNIVGENLAIGTIVGNLTTTDPDVGDTFTYSLVTGTGSTDNASFSIVGNQLQTNAIFNAQTKNSYSILLRTTDQGGLYFDQQFTININNLNNIITGTANSENFTTTAQKDIIDGQGGNDIITSTLANLQQNDSINGNTGIDTLNITDGTLEDVISIDLNNTTNQLNIPGTTIIGFEKFDLTGFLGTVSFLGTTGNDWITGGNGDDDLGGGNGDDYLNGGLGIDFLMGNAGNDTYIVDNIGDIIGESLNSGIDTVESSITWTLKANLEKLTLTGTAAINGTGNTLNNTLTGNAANNILNGGKGADTMIGGLGNDSYYVDNLGDVVTESANQGTDLVYSTLSYTLGINVENLTLQGTSLIDGTGNTLNNVLTGNSANNILTGLAGNDTLNGGVGTDTLIGGLGNDIYVVDNLGDLITENLNEGLDTVQSAISWNLGTNLENLTLTGTLAIDGTGNELSNTITGNAANNTLIGGDGIDTLTGNAGNDILVGGTGADVLTGGTGADIFRFNSSNEGLDNIKDFKVAELDIMQVSASGFAGGLVAGNLDVTQFISGAGITSATNSLQRFIYNTTNGALFYDADGNGLGSSALQIATLTGLPAITANHIQIIA